MRRREPAIPLMIRDILLSSEDTSPIDDGPRTHFITPTGAYVYRTVISGVLMEKDDIGTEESPLFRLRVADATGGLSFTVGRFNPGLLPTIEDLSIPSFVTVVGKISTFTSRRGEKVITLNPELIIPSERVERDTWHLIAARDALARIWKLEGRALPGSWLEVPPPAEPRGGEEVSELADSIVRDTLMSIDRTRFLKEIEMIRAGERHTVNDEEDSGVKAEGLPKNLLETYLDSRRIGLGEEVKRRIMLGTYTLSSGYYDAYYLRAQKVRTLVKEEIKKAFAKVDLILTPTTPTPAFKLGEKTKNPLEMYLEDIFTITANITGVPAISVPVDKIEVGEKKLPFGFQLMAKWFDEETLFRAADAYEKN